jgi:hypothetical protein
MALKRYNGKASIIMAAVFLILALLVINMPFPFAQHAMLSFVVYPALLLIAVSVGGIVSFVLGFAFITLSGIYAAGSLQTLPFSLFLLPISIVWLICLDKNIEYSKAVIMLLIAHVFATVLLIGYFRLFKPEITVHYLSEAFIKKLDSMREKDIVLYALTNTGLLSLNALPENIQVFNDAAGGVVFMPAARKELYSQLALRIEILLRSIPATMISGESIWISFCASTLALHIGRRYNKTDNAGSFQLPLTVPFSAWSLSPAMRKGLAVLFIGYLITSFIPGTLYLAGQMMFTALTTLLAIQGLSLITFWLSRFAKRFYLKLFLLFLIFIILNRTMAWIGLFDLFFNFRMRAMPIYPNQNDLNNKEDNI